MIRAERQARTDAPPADPLDLEEDPLLQLRRFIRRDLQALLDFVTLDDRTTITNFFIHLDRVERLQLYEGRIRRALMKTLDQLKALNGPSPVGRSNGRRRRTRHDDA